MRTIQVLIISLVIWLTGCATERHISPTITTPVREELSLKTPVLASVFDGRTEGADLTAAATLKAELAKIYGSSLQWASYFDSVPDGRLALRIRIVTLGSSFGSRLVSTISYATAVQSANIAATGPWGQVVGSATGTSSMFGGSVSGEGWWNGAAWVDIEVQDRRNTETVRFVIPLAAEHRESNMWGYTSGDKAARKAWQKVSAQLARAIDDILRVLRDGEG